MKIGHGNTKPPRIGMTPLMDIVLLLLAFFIYAMLSMAVRHGQTVELPRSSTVMPVKKGVI